jgi:hypothetical protein
VTTPPTFFEKLTAAAGQLGPASVLALVCLLIGWFFTNTLVTTMGPLEHDVRFFNLGDAVVNPMRLFVGGDVSVATVAFFLVCIASLLAPLAPHWNGNRALWPTYLAPMILLLVVGLSLYLRSSHDLFTTGDDADAVSRDLVRLANDLVNKGGELVARHVSVGLGGYLGLVGALVLAYRGFRLVRPAVLQTI